MERIDTANGGPDLALWESVVTAYRKNRCPGLAACIARHFQFLAGHPDAHRIIRQVAAASSAEWEAAAQEHAEPPSRRFAFRLH